MKIVELLEEKQELDELAIGRAIGKGATAIGKGIGATASGTVQAGKNFMKGLKHGWQTGRVSVAGDDEAAAGLAAPADNAAAPAGPAAGQSSTAAPNAAGAAEPSGQPAAQSTPAPTTAGPTAGQGQTAAPAAAGQGGNGGGAATANPQVTALKQQIDKLDPASKKELYATLSPDNASQQTKSGSGIIGRTIKKGVDALTKQMSKTPLPQKTDRRDFETPGGQTAAPADNAAAPAPADNAAAPAGNTMANAPVSASNTAKPGNPNLKTAEPAAEPSAGANAFGQIAGALTKQPAAGGASTDTASGKPSPEQIKQAQLKKDLLRKKQERAAGGTQPSGYAASGVGQSRSRLYTKADGSAGSYVVREEVEFYSKFLGKMI